MFTIKKTLEISASHKLELNYDSCCKKIHGHNWIITVFCKSENLNKDGMVVDFKNIKEVIKKRMDHKNLNDVFNFNPTAENIAKWIVQNVEFCFKAIVKESSNNEAIYEI